MDENEEDEGGRGVLYSHLHHHPADRRLTAGGRATVDLDSLRGEGYPSKSQRPILNDINPVINAVLGAGADPPKLSRHFLP